MTNRLPRSALLAFACLAAAPPTTGPTTGPATAPTTAPAPAGYTAVRRGTLQLSFDARGVLEPIDAFEVRFALRRYAGELTVRRAAAADATVAKGDVLLAVDTDPIDRQIAAAESAATVARAGLAKAESDVTLGERADALAMDEARLSAADAATALKRWDQTDGPAAVTSGTLGARQYADALSDATDELDQLHQMYKSEDLTNQTADIVLKRAARQVELDKVMVQLAKATSDRATTYEPAVRRHGLAAAAQQRGQAVEQLEASQAQERVVRAAAVTAARAAVAAADRAVADLKHDRADLTVTSPVDGVVVYGAFAHKAWAPVDPKRLAVEEKVSPATVLMTVCQPGKLRVAAACPGSCLTRLPPGTRVTVRPEALPDVPYDGTTGPASPFGAADRDGASTYDVPVTLPPVDARLAPGFAADVEVDVPPAEDVLVVPATAVYHGKAWVRGPDGHDAARPVEVGRRDGDRVEVRAGLKPDELVRTKGKL